MSTQTLRLWDPVVRLFHWSLAGSFITNFFFTEPGEDWHERVGYYAAAWVLIRVVWGFVGPQSARWTDFWPTPARLSAHFNALRTGRPFHRLGHSPIGALVMILMMLCMLGLGVSGYLLAETDMFFGDEFLEEFHEVLANGLAGLVFVHLFAAIMESVRLKENLPLSMVTGRRKPLPDDHAV